ncbi:hypothetical protein [Streptomyces europaeiscabiei]|uniref:hypothetical protein n=1 Tax=Streptomyces europaeiscabiei TaxID=146819 RepID=UPI0029B0815F|nr:hypothetical protein [Streptomyces europaeiscabiei]MDX3587332.1 hypothetical protein [Streptomyces europaeiscabiei]
MSINPNPDRRARYAAAIAEGFRAFDADTTSDAHLDAELLDAVVAAVDAEAAELLAAVSVVPPATNQAEAGQAGEERPETPLEKRLRYSERRNDELRAESLRRGKVNLEYAEKIVALERQLDEVRGQLGAEILRAGQAEAELRRLAAEAPHAETPDEAAALLALVRDFLDPDPCSFDHHGYCQAHAAGFGGEPLSCPHGRARKLLAAAAPAVVAQPGKETQT